MMFSFSKSSPANLSTYSGKKPGGADNELLPLALQHHRGFAGSQCCPALNRIRLTLESDLLPRVESIEFQVIRLRIDFLHSNCVYYHILDESLAPAGGAIGSSVAHKSY